MHKTVAMILAGGKGTRMDIFCHARPKPALFFGGKYRVIDFTLSNCLNSEIKNIDVLVDYQRDVMAEYLQAWGKFNQQASDLGILKPKENSYRGTADAVYQNLDRIQRKGEDQVLVLAGDHIYKMDYRKMIAYHEAVNAEVTVGTVRIPLKEAYRFGTLSRDTEGRITEFEEKSATPRSNLASMGIYIFNTGFLAKTLSEDAAHPVSLHDFGYSILPNIIKSQRVFAYEFSDYWQDIGAVQAYYEANLQVLQENTNLIADSTWPIFTACASETASEIRATGSIENSVIGPGCVIEGRVENSILSPGVWVGEKAEVKDSVVMANTHIGSNSLVERCILDEGVEVGNYCKVGFGITLPKGLPDITMVGKAVVVPALTAIGRRCKIWPGLRLADLNLRFVASDTTVSSPA